MRASQSFVIIVITAAFADPSALATALIVYANPVEIVIAADTAVFSRSGRLLPERQCKIIQNGTMLFAASGLLKQAIPPFDVLASARSMPISKQDPEETNIRFGVAMQSVIEDIWAVQGSDLKSAASRDDPGIAPTLITFVFIGLLDRTKRLAVRGSDVGVHLATGTTFIRSIPAVTFPLKEEAILKIGEAERLNSARIFEQAQRFGPVEALRRALARLASDHSTKVALPITIVEYRATGEIVWLHDRVCQQE